MVLSVSLSCTRILAKSVIWSRVRLQASALASAVTALVSSTDFLVFNAPRVRRLPWFYAPCQRDAEAARRANRASRGNYPY